MPSRALGGLSGRLVYGGSWRRALVIAVCLSWGAMNFIALTVERRTEMLIHPGGQYKALYFGDLICLPGLVLAIWYLGHYMPRPNLSHSRLWQWACFALGIAGGLTIYLTDAASRFYTRSQMYSPTKLYHDFVVMPCYTYVLFSAGIPVLFQSRGGWKARVLIVVLLIALALLNVYDALHRPHHGHINFDWRHFRPEG